MGVNYQEEAIWISNGFKCDKCGIEYTNDHDPVKLSHEFGYFSEHDLQTVEAYVCEGCFYNIIKDINGAVWDKYG